MELYGLVSFIDDYIFGDIKSYKNQFARLTNEINFDDLKSGLEYASKELDREIKCLKTESKKILKLDEKLKAQKDIK